MKLIVIALLSVAVTVAVPIDSDQIELVDFGDEQTPLAVADKFTEKNPQELTRSKRFLLDKIILAKKAGLLGLGALAVGGIGLATIGADGKSLGGPSLGGQRYGTTAYGLPSAYGNYGYGWNNNNNNNNYAGTYTSYPSATFYSSPGYVPSSYHGLNIDGYGNTGLGTGVTTGPAYSGGVAASGPTKLGCGGVAYGAGNRYQVPAYGFRAVVPDSPKIVYVACD